MEKRKISKREMNHFKNQLIQAEKSHATIEKYLRDLGAFVSYVGDEAIDKTMVVSYKEMLLEQYATSSVNSMLAAVNCFLREMGWYDCVVKTVKVQHQAFRSKERELTKEEYYRLLKAARKRNDQRLYLLMQTICATGIRVSELRFITVESLKTGRAKVSLKGKTRQVLMPKELIRELKLYCRVRKIQHGSIFVTRNGKPMDRSNILHAMKELCHDARVSRDKVFPHNLRHLFACLYYKVSKDLSRLADLLGHSNVNTTRIYTCVSGTEQQRQIDRLGLVISVKENTA